MAHGPGGGMIRVVHEPTLLLSENSDTKHVESVFTVKIAGPGALAPATVTRNVRPAPGARAIGSGDPPALVQSNPRRAGVHGTPAGGMMVGVPAPRYWMLIVQAGESEMADVPMFATVAE